jgi:transposase
MRQDDDRCVRSDQVAYGRGDVLDPGRLSGLVDIGVDEISWKKHHNYLTLVSNHATGKIVWGKAGKDTATLDAFFGELPEGAAEELEAVSMDLGPAYAKSVRTRAPRAAICFDPFHVVKLATEALEAVRRQVWQSARKLRDQSIAKKFKGARWALLKNPLDLTEDQSGTVRYVRSNDPAVYCGGPISSRSRCGRCSSATLTPPTRVSWWTAGARKRNGAESPNS